MKIEIWSDVVCPWCYVGKRRLETALAGFEHRDEVEVVYRSFELDPTAPQHGHELTTGVLARKYGRTEDEMRDMQQQLVEVAAQEGLAFRLFENVHTNTVDAHRVLQLALAEGGPDLQRELKEALLAAYFVRAEDVGDHDVLRAAARAASSPAARAYGATGVPFYVVDRKFGVSGAQPAEVFGQVLEQAWAESRPRLQMAGEGDACGPEGCAV